MNQWLNIDLHLKINNDNKHYGKFYMILNDPTVTLDA